MSINELFNPSENESGIILLKGVSGAEAIEIIEKLKSWIANREETPFVVIGSIYPDISIEYIKVGEVEDIRSE